MSIRFTLDAAFISKNMFYRDITYVLPILGLYTDIKAIDAQNYLNVSDEAKISLIFYRYN